MDKDMVFEEHWQLELAPARGTCAQLVLFRCLLCEEVASVKSPVPAYSPTPVARLTSAALNASSPSCSRIHDRQLTNLKMHTKASTESTADGCGSQFLTVLFRCGPPCLMAACYLRPSSVPGHQAGTVSDQRQSVQHVQQTVLLCVVEARFVGGARRTAHHSTRRRPSPRTTCLTLRGSEENGRRCFMRMAASPHRQGRASVKLVPTATAFLPA